MRGLLLLMVFAFIANGAQAQDVALPSLDQRVTDFTNTLTFAEWELLEKQLKAYEDSTSNQVVVLMVKTTGSMGIEEFATRVFERNHIGQKSTNNGVLLLVALDDRAVRIEVGYGLEGVLTDAITRKIIEQEIKPRFLKEQYFGGIIAGVYAMTQAVTGEYTADTRGDEAPAVGSGLLFFLLAFVFFVVRPMLAMRRRLGIGSRGHRYYSGWGWPGGFGGGGGGFGGFGGGGGGGFGGFSGGGGLSGGGGATGRW